MLRAIALRNKPSKRLPDQFPGCVSQHPVHGGIRERNPPVAVDHDHGIRKNVEQIRYVAQAAGHGFMASADAAIPENLHDTEQVNAADSVNRSDSKDLSAEEESHDDRTMPLVTLPASVGFIGFKEPDLVAPLAEKPPAPEASTIDPFPAQFETESDAESDAEQKNEPKNPAAKFIIEASLPASKKMQMVLCMPRSATPRSCIWRVA